MLCAHAVDSFADELEGAAEAEELKVAIMTMVMCTGFRLRK